MGTFTLVSVKVPIFFKRWVNKQKDTKIHTPIFDLHLKTFILIQYRHKKTANYGGFSFSS